MSTKITFQHNEKSVEIGTLANNEIQINKLLSTARTTFKVPKNKPVVLQYKDDEGDLITVSSQSDLTEALQLAKSTKSIKFIVTDKAVGDFGFELVDGEDEFAGAGGSVGNNNSPVIDDDVKKPESPQDTLPQKVVVGGGVAAFNEERIKSLMTRYLAEFVQHQTIPDRSVHSTNTRITKSWVVENIGGRTWPEGCVVNWMSGDDCLKSRGFITREVVSGDKVTISVDIVLPSRSGRYTGFYRLAIPSGKEAFGPHLWIDVIVSDGSVVDDVKQLDQVKASDKPAEPKQQQKQQDAVPVSCPQTFGKYNAPMKQLWDMGYRDLGLNVYLLDQNKGDVQTVVLKLVDQSGR